MKSFRQKRSARNSILGILALTLFLPLTGRAADPSRNLAPTPPMGWNSWAWFGKKNINEQTVRECIDAIVSTGLRDAGYTYVVVDGGWRDTKLSPEGELLADPVKFPHGMKSLADYAHSKGLKFGLHTVPGTHDCGGDPVGGYGHEAVQVKQFADWGLDFVKLDKCKFSDGWSDAVLQATYGKWSDLLAHCGRPIVFSMSVYKYYDWYPHFGQMGRTTWDIRSKTHAGAVFDGRRGSVMANAEGNNQNAAFAGHGYWNDPDMLATGEQGLTPDEQQSHFALWCVMSAPLMLGDDPRTMTQGEKDVVLNRDAIAIDQDATEQGRRLVKHGDAEVWVKHLADNRLAVLLLNRNAGMTNLVTADWKELGLSGKMDVEDVYGKKDLGSMEGAVSMPCPPHGCRLLLLHE
jgi:alpha-galactosidase